MVKAYFKDIHLKIIEEIENAQSDIKICVAWFTDFDIYNRLIKKLQEDVNIEVVIANHHFNKKSRVDYKEFLKLNGKVSYLGKSNGGSRDRFMHNKFAIIDNNTVITGSYNWSFKARLNDENILVVKNDLELTNQFVEKFNDLKPQFGFAIENNKVAILPIQNIMKKWEKPSKREVKSMPKPTSSVVTKSRPTIAQTNGTKKATNKAESILNKF